MRIFGLFVLVLIALLGLAFAVLNAAPVKLELYLRTVEMPLSLAVVGAFALGAALGIIASLGLILKSRRELARCRRQADHMEQELHNLRALPIKDVHG